MEVFIYLMRMMMLIYSLHLVGHQRLHPIFVSICGLLQAITVVFKSMKGKKKFYKLTTADINEPPPAFEIIAPREEETIIMNEKEFRQQRERALS